MAKCPIYFINSLPNILMNYIGHLAMYIPSCHITVWFCLLFSWALLRSVAAGTTNDQPKYLNFQLLKKLKNADFIPLLCPILLYFLMVKDEIRLPFEGLFQVY